MNAEIKPKLYLMITDVLSVLRNTQNCYLFRKTEKIKRSEFQKEIVLTFFFSILYNEVKLYNIFEIPSPMFSVTLRVDMFLWSDLNNINQRYRFRKSIFIIYFHNE